MKVNTTARIITVLAVCLLSSCGWLDKVRSKEGSKAEPAKLEKFTQEVKIRQLWSVNVSDGQGKNFNRLKPVYSNGNIYAASHDGEVVAVNADTGKKVWHQKTRHLISGAVGASNGLVLIGTESSQVVAFEADTGKQRWSVKVSSEVLSPPATDGQIVVVQTLDGNLIGLNASDGAQRWSYESTVPGLSLRGTSSPLIVQNFVLAAFGNGTVISIALDNGTLRWEERVAIPTGRSEIDRLIDIDGDLYINETNLVIAPSYQGYVSAIDVVTGQTRWRNEESSYVGASTGFGNLYVVDDKDALKAYRVGQPDTAWVNDDLTNRKLSAPLGFSNFVAVGDFEGYVHLFSQVDGRLVGRTKVDGDGVRSPMLNQGNTLYVYGNSGKLVALSVQ